MVNVGGGNLYGPTLIGGPSSLGQHWDIPDNSSRGSGQGATSSVIPAATAHDEAP